ncbi:MAG: efflux RND transporter periplasmic adaptor subunit [Dysgonamonadaceae bacterium]|jgi:Cu(I)/Ag(I) efflux system membrane fusion protein|nr:efflux RND transporter periplasmic adaptor subunit [Dysgonamonadaceae bacterium]
MAMKTKAILIGITILVAGLTTGCKNASDKNAANTEAQVWTCSMHPQIRQDHPGKCPICAMNLIPLKTSESIDHPISADAIMLSKEAAALADIRTSTVGRSRPVKDLYLYGTIQPDERRIHSLVSQVNGRIEKLSVNFAGETIRKGQTVAVIYSSDLLNAQQELLEAVKLQQPALLLAAREKLRLWKLTDRQIAAIEQSGNISPLTEMIADAGGIVTAKKVEQGESVGPGSVLFDLADLSSIWAVFEAYEADLPYLKNGDRVEYTVTALPGQLFSGKIAFIDPVLDKITRTAKVRVETANPRLQLKPEMYINARIQASLQLSGDAIVIPKTAILWTGPRSIVYVKQPHTDTPVFQWRNIELGPSLGDAYVVVSGLNEGEEIVTNGVFAVDASAQLEGKPSMMNSQKQTTHATLTVHGACGMCKTRIEEAALGLKGVTEATWNGETQELHLHFDSAQTSIKSISKAISGAGHDTELDKADDAVYNALPGCCLYRE